MTTTTHDEIEAAVERLIQVIRSEAAANRTEFRWIVGVLVSVLVVLFGATGGMIWSLGTKVTGLDSSVGQLSTTVEKLGGLELTVTRFDSTVSALDSTVSNLSGSVRELRGSVDTLAQRVSYIEGSSGQKAPQKR